MIRQYSVYKPTGETYAVEVIEHKIVRACGPLTLNLQDTSQLERDLRVWSFQEDILFPLPPTCEFRSRYEYPSLTLDPVVYL
jgi:hypothetical protein